MGHRRPQSNLTQFRLNCCSIHFGLSRDANLRRPGQTTAADINASHYAAGDRPKLIVFWESSRRAATGDPVVSGHVLEPAAGRPSVRPSVQPRARRRTQRRSCPRPNLGRAARWWNGDVIKGRRHIAWWLRATSAAAHLHCCALLLLSRSRRGKSRTLYFFLNWKLWRKLVIVSTAVNWWDLGIA